MINKYKFVKVTLDKNSEMFIIYIITLETSQLVILVHLFQRSLLAALQLDMTTTKNFSRYVDYADVFSSDLAIELLKNTNMNEHIIKLIESKQPSYKLTYSPSLVELETLKACIETYPKTKFI